MPTYDYVCDACQHQFEAFQSIKDEPKRKCPKCGRQKLRRLIGPGAAIVFKGSGFYETDYRSESCKKAAAAEKARPPAATKASRRKATRRAKRNERRINGRWFVVCGMPLAASQETRLKCGSNALSHLRQGVFARVEPSDAVLQ